MPDRMDEVLTQLAEIRETVDKLENQSDFWHRPSISGGRTRAQQVEDLLSALRAGGLVSRGLLWIAGIVIAIGSAVPHIRGWLGK